MLTQYDEYPVHQSPYPFSEIPSTDFAWCDGYFFGLYSAAEEVFFFSGMRVSPNTDMIGGYAGLTVKAGPGERMPTRRSGRCRTSSSSP